MSASKSNSQLSLGRLMDPEVLANPYPLYKALREQDPVHWDPFLHSWVVTRYSDVVAVMLKFSADRSPAPEHLAKMGLPSDLTPIAGMMQKQLLFMDAPCHTGLRSVFSSLFTQARMSTMREQIQTIADALLDQVVERGSIDVIADFARPFPAMVLALLFGVPVEDHEKLTEWAIDFAQVLGNFQHNAEHAEQALESTNRMAAYFREAIQRQKTSPCPGMVQALLDANVGGKNLDEESVIANLVLTMAGGRETTTNLIGCGLSALLQHPDELELLQNDPALIPSAVEEFLRYESPSQHTARIVPHNMTFGGKHLKKGQAVMTVFGAANRDPERFADPDRLDVRRSDNRHLAFAWGAHYCVGAPMTRIEGQVAFETLLRRLPNLRLEPQEMVWGENLGLRGLKKLFVSFDRSGRGEQVRSKIQCPWHGAEIVTK